MFKMKIGEKEYDEAELRVLEKAGVLNVGSKHDTSSSTPNATPTNGPFPGNNAQFGIFSLPNIRPGLWNATPRVRSIGQYIPMFKSLLYEELIQVATGVTAGSGSNSTSACAVGPKPGQLKAMSMSARFGIIHESTKIIDVTQAGMRRNRGDVDRQTFNAAAASNPWLPRVPGADGDPMSDVLRAEMYALGIDLERNVSQVHFLGVSGTENDTYRGIARQWNGLDRLIRTGWQDADSGQLVPAADAEVQTFNAAIDGGTQSVTGRTILGVLIDTYFGQVDFLQRIGVQPVFALVMRPDLFRALAAIWACQYNTTRCISSAAGQPLVRDAVSVRAEYEAILAGEYLPMDGVNVPVLMDDSILRETLGNGYFKSDVYGVCLTGNGRPMIYGEYFDMDNPEAMRAVQFAGGESTMTTVNDGMYRVFKRVTGGCVEFDFFARPRLITDAPFAHFRVDDLFYRSDYDQRDAIPGQSYYVNGGRTYTS